METLYTDERYSTKKALTTAVKASKVGGTKVHVYSASVFGNGKAPTGKHTLCGPAEYERNYYAEITVDSDGNLTSIK